MVLLNVLMTAGLIRCNSNKMKSVIRDSGSYLGMLDEFDTTKRKKNDKKKYGRNHFHARPFKQSCNRADQFAFLFKSQPSVQEICLQFLGA